MTLISALHPPWWRSNCEGPPSGDGGPLRGLFQNQSLLGAAGGLPASAVVLETVPQM